MVDVTTKNLTLREFKITDVDNFFQNNQDELIKRFLDYRYYSTKEDALKTLEGFISRYPNKDLPYYVAIIKTDTNQLIGHIGVGKMQNVIELEFAIGKAYRGNRFATESVIAFVTWCKNNLMIDHIYALVKPENTASCYVLESSGFSLLKDNEISFKLEPKARKIFYI